MIALGAALGLTDLFRNWSGSNDEYVWLKNNVFGWRRSKVLISQFEMEPCYIHVLSSADVGVGYGRDLQPSTRCSDPLTFGSVGLPSRLDDLRVGFLHSSVSIAPAETGADRDYARQEHGSEPIPAFPAAMLFLLGVPTILVS